MSNQEITTVNPTIMFPAATSRAITTIVLFLAVVTTTSNGKVISTPTTSTRIISGGSGSNSPWCPASWCIQFDLGNRWDDKRDLTTTAAAAAWDPSEVVRVGFGVEVLVDSERIQLNSGTTEHNFMEGRNTCYRLSVIQKPTYVQSLNVGQVTIQMKDKSGWNMYTQQSTPARSNNDRTNTNGKNARSVVRLWLTVIDEIKRNDVTIIPAGSQLLCTANCWRESDYSIAQQRIQPILKRLRMLQDTIDAQVQHETGDRRLDGTNPIDTVLAYADMAVLIQKRDQCVQELRQMEPYLPLPHKTLSSSLPGHWPGSTEKLIVTTGKVVVQRRNPFGWNEFSVVGTWTAKPMEGSTQ